VIQLTEKIRASSASSKKALCDERDQVLANLNARLAKYKWHPVVRAHTSPCTNFDVHYEFAKSDAADLENQAVQWLMNHIDVVHRIRPCHRQECGKWFFAKTDHQKYCEPRCRKQDAAQGEVFKEKRRLYMKKYRRAEAERTARAI